MEAATNPERSAARLSGARVLVVEDDFFIALELTAVLSDAGAEIVGPSNTVESALRAADGDNLSAAILDIRLGSETVEPVARRLTERHVPFLFYTGQARTDPLRAEWPDCRVLVKPTHPDGIVKAVAEILKTRGLAAPS